MKTREYSDLEKKNNEDATEEISQMGPEELVVFANDMQLAYSDLLRACEDLLDDIELPHEYDLVNCNIATVSTDQLKRFEKEVGYRA